MRKALLVLLCGGGLLGGCGRTITAPECIRWQTTFMSDSGGVTISVGVKVPCG